MSEPTIAELKPHFEYLDPDNPKQPYLHYSREALLEAEIPQPSHGEIVAQVMNWANDNSAAEFRLCALYGTKARTYPKQVSTQRIVGCAGYTIPFDKDAEWLPDHFPNTFVIPLGLAWPQLKAWFDFLLDDECDKWRSQLNLQNNRSSETPLRISVRAAYMLATHLANQNHWDDCPQQPIGQHSNTDCQALIVRVHDYLQKKLATTPRKEVQARPSLETPSNRGRKPLAESNPQKVNLYRRVVSCTPLDKSGKTHLAIIRADKDLMNLSKDLGLKLDDKLLKAAKDYCKVHPDNDKK